MEQNKSKFGAIIPQKVTQSYLNFMSEIQNSEFLILMLLFGGGYVKINKEEVRQNLIEIYNDTENENSKRLIEYFKSEESDKMLEIDSYEGFYGQMCFARTIDNTLTYFKDILGEVILKTPEILKSQEKERLDFILKYDSIESLKIALAEKKIESLFYSGVDTIESFFKDRLGVSLFKTKEDKMEFNRVVKKRNLIVHNRGRVNKEYLKEFSDSSFVEGSSLSYSYDDISRINLILSNFVTNLDNEIAKKFKLDLKQNI